MFPARALCGETSVLSGRILDVSGNPVEGAKVFVYDGKDIRRPADFISAQTDKDGRFRMVLPAGAYWPVARLKKSGEYGPLMPGDKHSGEPEGVTIAAGAGLVMDFIVADLREAARAKTKVRPDNFKIQGRIIDQNGSAKMDAYAFANSSDGVSGMPDYLSAWVDEEGRYTLYLPGGRFFMGAASQFPSAHGYRGAHKIEVNGDRSGVDIVITFSAGAGEGRGKNDTGNRRDD